MRVSLYQRGYKKLAQIIFEWQPSDRASLLAFFILIEVVLQWAWGLMVWVNADKLAAHIDMSLFEEYWLATTVVAMFYFWLTYRLQDLKTSKFSLHTWQVLMLIVYCTYIAVLTTFLGYSGLTTGVSLVGGAMLAMLLIDKRIVWWGFILYVGFILIFTILPYYGIEAPSLRKVPLPSMYNDVVTSSPSEGYAYTQVAAIHDYLVNMSADFQSTGRPVTDTIAGASSGVSNADIDQVLGLQRSNLLFWQMTSIYFALPKAMVIVYLFRSLLTIIDRNKREIQYNADHDALTGLKNRRSMLSWIHQSLFNEKHKNAYNQDYSVILLDLDYFKAVNDTYGHPAGDQVLQDVSELLSHALMRRHEVSRYGGEEFLLALPNTSHSTALMIAEALRKEIEEHIIYIGNAMTLKVTASFGVSTLSQQDVAALQTSYMDALNREMLSTAKSNKITEMVIHKLIEVADTALYEAKDNGRNQVASADQLVLSNKIAQPSFGV